MYKMLETKSYVKKLKKFLKKHPDIFKKYEKTIYILEANPNHPSLRLHKLEGKLKDFYSTSIDMEYRIILLNFRTTQPHQNPDKQTYNN